MSLSAAHWLGAFAGGLLITGFETRVIRYFAGKTRQGSVIAAIGATVFSVALCSLGANDFEDFQQTFWVYPICTAAWLWFDLYRLAPPG